MRSERIKAFTVWQPWATLIIEGVKPWEFRTWDVPTEMVGRRIVIHAGKREMHPDEVEWLRDACRLQDRSCGISPALFTKAIEILARPLEAFPLGAAIGDARLGSGQLVRAAGMRARGEDARPRYAWPMLEVHKWAEPIAMAILYFASPGARGRLAVRRGK